MDFFNLRWLGLAILILSEICHGQLRQDLNFFHLLREVGFHITGRTSNDPRLLQLAVRAGRIQKKVPLTTEFPCRFMASDDDGSKNAIPKSKGNQVSRQDDDAKLPRVRSKIRPTSVHALRPGDIDIIAAMGDSLTAGSGAAASNILHVGTENRGVSWSIGGQGTWREYLTLPNILKVFNPNLIGYSLRDALGHHNAVQFNVAEVAAMSSDLVYMAKQLVVRMNRDQRVNIKKDWKLVTLLIGGNDFCLNVCYLKNPKKAPERHRQELLEALLVLKDNLPRTFVNLVPAPNVEVIRNFTGKPPLCELTHRFECPCLFGEPNKWRYPEIREIMSTWQRLDIEMENAPELNDREDFAVVVQPFDVDIVFPVKNGYTDFSFLSTDCFHFSQKSYARTANAIWNNMMQPVGKKNRNWRKTFKEFRCPTVESPYIYTLKNSRSNRTLS